MQQSSNFCTLEKDPAFGEDVIATSNASCAMHLHVSHWTRLFTQKTLLNLKCHDSDNFAQFYLGHERYGASNDFQYVHVVRFDRTL